MNAIESEKNRLINSFNTSGWNLSDERAFMENLFVGRFNFFLLVFSLFVTAGFANSFRLYKYIVFYAGAFVLFLVWLSLYRGFRKHDRIMRIIFNEKKSHPAAKLADLMKLECFKPRYRVSYLMGIWIPLVCIGFLVIIAILVHCGILA